MSIGEVELILILFAVIYLAVPVITLFYVIRLSNRINHLEALLRQNPPEE